MTRARKRGLRDLLILVGVVVCAVANGAPQVDIKAKTQLALSHVKLRDDGIEVTGSLVDKLTGDGIGGQNIRVHLGATVDTAVTQPDGSFRTVLHPDNLDTGAVKVELEYNGGRALDRATPLSVTTDPTKQQVELDITKLGEDPTGAKVRVVALGEDGPLTGLVVQISVAPQGSETWKPLVVAAQVGEPFVLARKAAGGPGMYRLRAVFAGDEHSQAASKDVLIELASTTTTTIVVSAQKLAYEDDLTVTGVVTDEDHHPVAQAAVTLTSGDRKFGSVTTNDDGRYKFTVEAAVIGTGELGLQTQADPGKVSVKPSRSDIQIIKVASPAPVPVSYTVIAFVATVLAAGAFFIARKQPWLRLRRPAPPAEVPTEDVEVDVGAGGLVVAKPGVMSTLRRAADDGFSGVVRDTVRGRPIAEAVVRVVIGEVEREVRTGADGSFAIEHLGVGDWRGEVAALGHISERFDVTIPHRGELRGVRIDLVPVREKVFQLYRRAAEPILPEPRLWGIWSPRQIVDHVRTKRPTPALAELTDFVEEIYFSPRLAAEAIVVQATERVERAIHERASTRRA